MLNWMRIRNLALVEKADIEFCAGFNVITGETGAGKSVIIGSISLLLGERADKGAIRRGASRCEIAAGISITSKEMQLLLDELGIAHLDDGGGELQIRRVITESNTRNFINDTPVTLQTLKSVAQMAIDVHSANEHQSVFNSGVQMDLLDRYTALAGELAECGTICDQIKEVSEARDLLEAELPSSEDAEHLRKTVSDIESANPQVGEDSDLAMRHALAANSKQLLELTSQAVLLLNESDSAALNMLSEIFRILQDIERIDERGAVPFLKQCEGVMEEVRELAFDLEAYAEKVELDEQEFAELEDRIAVIQALKRRYGSSLDDVFITLDDALRKLDSFDNAASARECLENRALALKTELANVSKKLSLKRKKGAEQLAKAVTRKLKTLGFLKSDFKVDFSDILPGRTGSDKIDFIFSANPGEQAYPLRSIASSGEISRIVLALKAILAAADSVPILIFDEIDVNIGGETAAVVGEELLKLAKSHQVICISHLPQVAVKAERHFTVSKSVQSGRTFTFITDLDYEQRHREITRMLGGGKAASQHAKELLNDLQGS